MSRWYRGIAERPGWVLLGVLAFTAFCLAGLVDLRTGKLRLGIDPSAEGLLPGSGPERELFDRARRLFGSDEALIVALGADDLFQSDALERVKKLTRRIEKLDGVQNVLSLATAVNVRSQDGDIVVGPLLEVIPRDPEGLRRLREEVLANPLYAGNLISRDGGATALVISIVRMSDRDLIERGIDAAIVRAAHEEAGDLEVWVSGIPHVKTYLGTSLLRELSIMLPGIILVLGVVAFIALRTVRGVLLPLATIGVALVGTLGMLGWLGQSLNLVTSTVPALILIMGFTEGMHVVAEFYAELAEGEHSGQPVTPAEAVARCLGSVGMPVLACAVTTAVGFLSLAFSPVPAVQEWGLFSLLGVTYTSVVSLVFTPAVLALLPAPPRIPRGISDGRLERLSEPIAAFAIRHRWKVLAVTFALIALSALGATRIRVAAEFPGSLDPASPIRRDYEAINARLGGANEMRILVESDLPQAFLEPASLAALHALQQWLEAQPEVGDSVSIADYLMLLNAALAGKPVGEASLPGTRSLTSQLLLFGASPETKRFVDVRHQTANVLVRVKVGDSDATSALVERIQGRLAELPNYLHASVTGSSVLVNRVVDDLARSQRNGLVGGLLLIYLVLAAFLWSPLIGAVALIPNALPIALYFGVLGWTGITLNPTTSLVGSLALGICCDDTIHYFARFSTEARRLHDESRAVVTTLRALIRPMAFATVGLCLGFLVLTASEQRGQAEFALLAAFTIFAAGLIELTVSPALSSRLKIVTLWDVLRLDLGPAPEREIPLFEGLSLRQARVFTIMSDVRRLVPGERLLTEGESGDDMFVVLDGELEVWVERDGARVELNRLSRGATVGEVGYFALKRTATVAARTDATLIRFDSEDLDRLRRRYPRIGAVVYRNLNKIQAARMVETTRRLKG